MMFHTISTTAFKVCMVKLYVKNGYIETKIKVHDQELPVPSNPSTHFKYSCLQNELGLYHRSVSKAICAMRNVIHPINA